MSDELSPADVVLGGLGGEQAARAERLMRTDPAFRAEVQRLRQAAHAVRTAAAVGAIPEPPALALDAALAARPAWDAVPAGRSTVPTAVTAPRRRRDRLAALRRRLRAPVAVSPPAAALACGALVLAGLAGGLAASGGGRGGDANDEPALAVSGPAVPLRAFAGFQGAGRVAVHLPARAGQVGDLVADGLAPSPSGHYYELWLLSDGKRLASLGSFRVGADGRARIRFVVAADPRAYRYLDVSVEPDDGDPAHSSRSVLRSRALT